MAAAEKKKGAESAKETATHRTIDVKMAAAIAVPVIAVFLLFYLAILPSPLLNVPFPTFKANFAAAPRVAVLLGYSNESQYPQMAQCATQLIQVLAQSRSSNTIDYFVLNQSACTYPVGGLGHSISIGTNTTAHCLNAVKNEPSIFLNYSASNYTVITAYRLYAHGNSRYMASCPLAIEMS